MATSTYSISRTTGATSIALAQNFTITMVQPAGGLPHATNNTVTELFFPVPANYIGDNGWYKNDWLFFGNPSRNTGSKPTYDPANPRSTTNLRNFPWAVGTWGTQAGLTMRGTVFSSTFVDMRRVHAIYLHSLDIGNMASIAPRGIRTCLAVIPVTSGYGGMTVWTESSNVNNYIEPATRSIRRISFETKTSGGDIINLQGGDWTAVFAIGPRPL